MMSANYKTKKELKSCVGQKLDYQETSIFGNEYKPTGKNYVVGPTPLNRKWWAEVLMENNLIKKVS